jgi:hypothetical protein
MEVYKHAFGAYNASQFRFPKFHGLVHLVDFIRRFGSLQVGAGYSWEKAILEFLRKPYGAIRRHTTDVHLQLARSLALRATTIRVLSLYDTEEVQETLNYDVRPVGSGRQSRVAGGATTRPRSVHRSQLGGVTFSLWTPGPDGRYQCDVALQAATFAADLLPPMAREKVSVTLPDL